MTDITFIHIPKTGGSALKHELKRCPDVLTDKDYGKRRHQVSSINANDSFAIIRHPLDRFVSAGVFALRGSEKMTFKKKKMENRKKFDSLSMFVDSLRDPDDPHYHFAHKIFDMKKKKHGWTAFDLQTDWIDDSTDIVCYDKDKLQENVNGLFNKRGITCDIDLKHVNVTKKEDFDVSLSKEQIEWVEEKYRDDFILWEKHCKPTLL